MPKDEIWNVKVQQMVKVQAYKPELLDENSGHYTDYKRQTENT